MVALLSTVAQTERCSPNLCTVAQTKQCSSKLAIPCHDALFSTTLRHCFVRVLVMIAGMLANLTCILAELYQMQAAMSVTVNPEWVVPYAADAEGYQELLDDFSAYVQARSPAVQPCMCTACMVLGCVYTGSASTV